MAMPIIFQNVYTGLNTIDKKLLQMVDIYQIGELKKIKYIYKVKIKPFLSSSLITISGLIFKAGVSAELIAITDNSIGKNLYNSKIYLDMPSLFAWTISIILIAILEIVSVFIFTTKVTGKYPRDKILKNKRTSSFLIILIMVVLGSLATSVNLIFREEIIYFCSFKSLLADLVNITFAIQGINFIVDLVSTISLGNNFILINPKYLPSNLSKYRKISPLYFSISVIILSLIELSGE